VLPHRSVGREVLLKVKQGCVSAYWDDELLISYLIPEGTGHFVQDERLYRALREDSEQIRMKYHWMDSVKGKGRAKRTLGIIGGVSDTITVDIRPIHDYVKIVEG